MSNQKLLKFAQVLFATFTAIQTVSAETLTVNATIPSACTIATPPSVEFGTINSNATFPINAQTPPNLEINCSQDGNYSIKLGAGNHPTGSTPSRAMANPEGGGTIGYELYQDAEYLTIWGDGTIGTAK